MGSVEEVESSESPLFDPDVAAATTLGCYLDEDCYTAVAQSEAPAGAITWSCWLNEDCYSASAALTDRSPIVAFDTSVQQVGELFCDNNDCLELLVTPPISF